MAMSGPAQAQAKFTHEEVVKFKPLFFSILKKEITRDDAKQGMSTAEQARFDAYYGNNMRQLLLTKQRQQAQQQRAQLVEQASQSEARIQGLQARGRELDSQLDAIQADTDASRVHTAGAVKNSL